MSNFNRSSNFNLNFITDEYNNVNYNKDNEYEYGYDYDHDNYYGCDNSEERNNYNDEYYD